MKSQDVKMVLLGVVITLIIVTSVAVATLVIASIPDPVVQPQVVEPTSVPTLKDLQNGLPFRFVVPNNQHPIVRIMMLGFFEACDDYELDCVMAGIDGVDTAAIIARGEETISLGSSGVVFYPDVSFYEVQRKIMQAEIPMVGIHVPIAEENSDVITGWVATNTIDYSVRSAVAMMDKLGCVGPIATSIGGPNDVETPAVQAFTAKVKELCPDVEVFLPEEEGFEPSAAIAKAAAVLSANPDIKGAYSTTGAGSTTWATALRDAGYQAGDVIVISMDYSEQNLDWVRDGWVYALVGQPLYEETYHAVELLVELLQGNEIQFANDFPAPLIFQADVDKYYAYGERVVERFK